MMNVVLALHLMVAVALVGMVLMQRSEGGALGMGGGGGGGLMSGRGAANALARGTSILGAVFFFTSITLTILAGGARAPKSVVDAPTSSPLAPITEFISGLTKPAPKPAISVTPAPIVPLAPTPTPAPSAEIVPAPEAAVQRAAPLEAAPATAPVATPATTAAPRPAAVSIAPATTAPRPVAAPVAPAATVTRTQPSPSAIPRPAPLVRATPSVQVPATAALTSVKPAESSEPQIPADRPRGRAGPDE